MPTVSITGALYKTDFVVFNRKNCRKLKVLPKTSPVGLGSTKYGAAGNVNQFLHGAPVAAAAPQHSAQQQITRRVLRAEVGC